jgi:hypothetical protein
MKADGEGVTHIAEPGDAVLTIREHERQGSPESEMRVWQENAWESEDKARIRELSEKFGPRTTDWPKYPILHRETSDEAIRRSGGAIVASVSGVKSSVRFAALLLPANPSFLLPARAALSRPAMQPQAVALRSYDKGQAFRLEGDYTRIANTQGAGKDSRRDETAFGTHG